MVVYLAGDIGGTNCRLSLIDLDKFAGQEKLLFSFAYPSAAYESLETILTEFLTAAAIQASVDACCLAVAGPVKEIDGDRQCVFTNLKWIISKNSIMSKFNIPAVELINDFVAVGYGLLGLTSDDVFVINQGKVIHGAPIACLGAGTGLGEVFLTHNGLEYTAWPTEGGHVEFSPKNETEFQLQEFIKMKDNLERISVERIVSGIGIPYIYDFLASKEKEDPRIAEMMTKNPSDKASIISKNGFGAKSDPICAETMKIFLQNYAAETGNVALKYLPNGGLFIAGGIAPKLIEQFKDKTFFTDFISKGRMESILRDIPVYVVLHESVGELGSQVVARRLLKNSGRLGRLDTSKIISFNQSCTLSELVIPYSGSSISKEADEKKLARTIPLAVAFGVTFLGVLGLKLLRSRR